MGLTFKITDDSHADHLDAKTMGVVREIVRDGESKTLVSFPGFQIHEVTLPAFLPAVKSALRGPMTGEAAVKESLVHYGTRGGRPNISRLTNLPATTDRRVTVLVSQAKDSTEWTLVTAYGGPLAPQEPSDPYLPAEKHADSVAFWSEHALSVDGSPDATQEGDHAGFFTAAVKEEAS